MATIIPGSDEASRSIASSIAMGIDAKMTVPSYKVFPDGELYVRVSGDLESPIIVVKTMSPPQDSSIMEAMLLADALRGLGFQDIVLVAPYMAYSRQDRRFLEGEPVSIAVVLRALSLSGYSRLATVEIHKLDALNYFEGSSLSVSPFKFMADRVDLPDSPLVLAPDQGALHRARELASHLGVDYDYLVKERDRVTGEVRVKPREINAEGRDVVIVDDIISTGGTIAEASRELKKAGARRVYVMVAHALMAGRAVDKLRGAGVERVYASNSLPPRDGGLIHYVDIGPLLGRVLRDEGWC
ncbi:MAG: ribose-phosphate diphosphokinase [Desulfurococcales archaeon]|nr:ribose-phosphate diphosphokinase [Desulfurococcales archaeon]